MLDDEPRARAVLDAALVDSPCASVRPAACGAPGSGRRRRRREDQRRGPSRRRASGRRRPAAASAPAGRSAAAGTATCGRAGTAGTGTRQPCVGRTSRSSASAASQTSWRHAGARLAVAASRSSAASSRRRRGLEQRTPRAAEPGPSGQRCRLASQPREPRRPSGCGARSRPPPPAVRRTRGATAADVTGASGAVLVGAQCAAAPPGAGAPHREPAPCRVGEVTVASEGVGATTRARRQLRPERPCSARRQPGTRRCRRSASRVPATDQRDDLGRDVIASGGRQAAASPSSSTPPEPRCAARPDLQAATGSGTRARPPRRGVRSTTGATSVARDASTTPPSRPLRVQRVEARRMSVRRVMGTEVEYGISVPGPAHWPTRWSPPRRSSTPTPSATVEGPPGAVGLRGGVAAARRPRLRHVPRRSPTRPSSPTRTWGWPTSSSPTAPGSTSTTPTRSTPRPRSPPRSTSCAGTRRGSR